MVSTKIQSIPIRTVAEAGRIPLKYFGVPQYVIPRGHYTYPPVFYLDSLTSSRINLLNFRYITKISHRFVIEKLVNYGWGVRKYSLFETLDN
jgi:hypothetical protein